MIKSSDGMMKQTPVGGCWRGSDEICSSASCETIDPSGPSMLPVLCRGGKATPMGHNIPLLSPYRPGWPQPRDIVYQCLSHLGQSHIWAWMCLLGLFAEHFVANLLLGTKSSSYQGNNELIFNLSSLRFSNSLSPWWKFAVNSVRKDDHQHLFPGWL